MNKIFLILILTFLVSCSKKENDLEYEKKVMNEIVVEIVDTLYDNVSNRQLPPPPPPSILNGNGNKVWTKSDSLREVKRIADYHKQISFLRNELIKKDTTRLLIAVYDTVYSNEENGEKILINHFSDIEYDTMKATDLTNYKIDLSKIKNNSMFIFNYRSHFPSINEIWTKKYNFPFIGVVSLSRIDFDKSTKYGFLTVSYNIDRMNGNTFRIFIKKDQDKWQIDKMTML